ncbi:hypothetical protein EVJ58_g6907 [Rhodofomes roseus]|uniref:MYND-type domain-containing protein n=1 Tax=Rhodofomes roseus TaxID=34475 RepID=A0A4Y9Y6V9_9APHY|nr:hypothetical protein EVJ58_g6907 [Rhodofomes roseus]
MSTTPLLDDVALFFTACMRDPARPQACARVLCACVHIIDGHEFDEPFAPDVRYRTPQSDGYEYIRKTHHEYLNSCAAFLSLPRSKEETRELRIDAIICMCSLPEHEDARRLVQWLHTFGAARLDFELEDLVQALVRHLAGILDHAVTSKTIGGLTAVGGLKKHRRKYAKIPLWPTDTNQLIPHGLERSMKGYAGSLGLFLCIRFHEALLFFNMLLVICGHSIIMPVVNVDFDWPSRVTDLADALLGERRAAFGKPVDASTEQSWKDTLVLLTQCAEHFSDTRILNARDINLLACVGTVVDADEEQVESRGLLFVCHLLIRHLPRFLVGTSVFTQDDITRFTRIFALHGAVFYVHSLPYECLAVCPQIRNLFNAMQNTARAADPFILAFHGVKWAITMRRCSAPECDGTFMTAGRPLARCAGCGVLRYCSHECQKRAWKHALLSHRTICAKLRMLLEGTRLCRARVISADHGRQSFVNACNGDEGLGVLARGCADHMYDLMAMRYDISEAFMAEAYRELREGATNEGDYWRNGLTRPA